MRVQEPYFGKLAAFAGRKIYLVAATLRPETMYALTQATHVRRSNSNVVDPVCVVSLRAGATLGRYGQTNCWVGPDVEYGLFEVQGAAAAESAGEKVLFVCTQRAANNMAFQVRPACAVAEGGLEARQLIPVRDHRTVPVAFGVLRSSPKRRLCRHRWQRSRAPS